jgi:hypothetical protein
MFGFVVGVVKFPPEAKISANSEPGRHQRLQITPVLLASIPVNMSKAGDKRSAAGDDDTQFTDDQIQTLEKTQKGQRLLQHGHPLPS